ncbi:unnamed protein product, partial [Allacma fusca]
MLEQGSMEFSEAYNAVGETKVVREFGADGANLSMGNFPTPLCIGVGTDLEFDATMAHIDMEDFHSQDILLRFPPLCASDLQ